MLQNGYVAHSGVLKHLRIWTARAASLDKSIKFKTLTFKLKDALNLWHVMQSTQKT